MRLEVRDPNNPAKKLGMMVWPTGSLIKGEYHTFWIDALPGEHCTYDEVPLTMMCVLMEVKSGKKKKFVVIPEEEKIKHLHRVGEFSN